MDRLTAESIARKLAIRARDVEVLTALWGRVGGADDRALARWIEAAVPLHTAALAAQVRGFTAYLTLWLEANGATVPVLPEPDDVVANLRTGVPMEEVLARPVIEFRSRLADGMDPKQAFNVARDRLVKIAGTDHQQAYRLAAHQSWSDSEVKGYRRVLSGSTNCILCIQASTVRYYSDRLMPIHPGCDCGVEPFTGSVNRAGTIRSELPRLEAAQKVAEQSSGAQYLDRDTLRSLKVDADSFEQIAEADHTELGPLLKVEKHHTSSVPRSARSHREFNPDGTLKRA